MVMTRAAPPANPTDTAMSSQCLRSSRRYFINSISHFPTSKRHPDKHREDHVQSITVRQFPEVRLTVDDTIGNHRGPATRQEIHYPLCHSHRTQVRFYTKLRELPLFQMIMR